MPQKRTRTVLSPEEKKVVIRIKTDNPKLKLNDIAEEFYKQTKKVISVTTVCNIWNNRKAIMDGVPYKTKKPMQDVSISQETIKRMEELEALDKPVSQSTIIELAQKVVLEHKLDPALYFFSPSWAQTILTGKVDDQSILKANQKPSGDSTLLQPISLTEDALATSNLERLLVPSASENVAILENKSQGMKGLLVGGVSSLEESTKLVAFSDTSSSDEEKETAATVEKKPTQESTERKRSPRKRSPRKPVSCFVGRMT